MAPVHPGDTYPRFRPHLPRSIALTCNGVAPAQAPHALTLSRNGLHVELVVRPGDTSRHPAGLADVRLESALSTIVDLEDSACTVDAEDKVAAHASPCCVQ